MKKIIVFLLGGIGDSLLATPMIKHLRKNYPDSSITVLTMYRQVEQLFQRNASVNKVIFFDFMKEGYVKSLSFVLRLRKEHYDLSFMTYPTNRLRPNLISFLIGAQKRMGHLYPIKEPRSLGFLHTHRIPIHSQRHTIDENLMLLQLQGVDITKADKKTNLPLTKEEETFADQFIQQHVDKKKHFLIGLHPGSSELAGMIYKRWPAEHFAAAADLLSERYKATVMLFGGENERALKQRIASMMKHKPILVDTPSIFHTAALIKKCSFFLSNDTGLMHFASTFAIPSVIVTGHINPEKTKPLHQQSKVLAAPHPCQPYQIGQDLACKHAGTSAYCLNQITIDQVCKAAAELLS